MPEKLSIKISNIQLLLSLLVVLIHCATYNVHTNGTELESTYGLNVSTFIQLFFTEGICRIAVPMFFVISGYLLFLNIDKRQSLLVWWKGKLKKRFFSLVIPYVFWSSLVFFSFYIAQNLIGINKYFANSIVGKLSIGCLWNHIICNSYNSPLWFLRYLIVFVLISPLLYWTISYLKYAAPPILLIVGTFYNPIHFRIEALFFFSVGAMMAIVPILGRQKESVSKLMNDHRFLYGLVFLWMIIISFKTIYLCQCDKEILLNGLEPRWVFWYRFTEICIGLVAVWFLFNQLPDSFTEKRIKICYLSFLFFVAHHPVVKALIKILSRLFGYSAFSSLLVFVSSFVFTILIVGSIGILVKRYMPKSFSFLCGGR